MRTTCLAALLFASAAHAQFEMCTIRGSSQDERMGSSTCGVLTASGARWIVGARGASVLGLPPRTGAIRILTWSAATGCSEPFFSPVPGAASNDLFGAACVPGPNGSVIVGSPGFDAPVGADAGKIMRVDPLSGFGTDLRIGPISGGQAGWAADSLGDMDLDGFPDYGIGMPRGSWLGCPLNGAHRGLAEIASAQPAPRRVGVLWGAGWCSGAYVGFAEDLGWDVSPLGDINGNGRPECLIGSYGYSRVYLCEVDASGALVTTRTDTGPSQFGAATCPLGDVNNDAIPDYAAGAPAAREVRVIDGATGAVLRSWIGLQPRFGERLACVGDQDNDGISDLLVGAPGALSDTGEAYLFSVGTGHMLALMRGTIPGGQFGRAVAGIPDMTGDGRQELGVGAPEATINGAARAGYATLFTLDGTLAKAQLYGAGCVPQFAAGPEPLVGTPLGALRLGADFAFSASRCRPNRAAVLVVDFQALPVPLALCPLVPSLCGCSLWVSPTVNVATTSTTRTTGTSPGDGYVEHRFAVPNNPLFANTQMHAQWYVVDPGPSPLSGTMTRALLVMQ